MYDIQETDRLTLKNGITYLLIDAKARTLIEELGERIEELKGAPAPLYYAVCNTGASTAQKTITVPEITELTSGLSINVKFTNTNSASNPKLKLNDFAAAPIYQYGSTAAGTAAATTGWQAGAVVQLTYDGNGWVRDQGYNTNSTYNVPGILCTTAADTAAKTASGSYYSINAGNIFPITFRYTNTKAAALTLSVNSTATYSIYIDGKPSSATNYSIHAGVYICYFDGAVYHLNSDGSAPIIAKRNYDLGTAIESGDDLNDYNTPGPFYCRTAAIAATLSNSPASDAAFRMDVIRTVAEDRLLQVAYLNKSTPTINVRTKTSSGWGSTWRTLALS